MQRFFSTSLSQVLFYFIRSANTKEEFSNTKNIECLPKHGGDTVPAPRPRRGTDKDTGVALKLCKVL